MARARPFALFITWTCYGHWLPGDPRGYVSDTVGGDGRIPKENRPGTPYTYDDPETLRCARGRQKWPTVTLDGEQARCVAESLRASAEVRGWRILRAAIMAEHVHVLIVDCPNNGPQVRRILKGASQAALSLLRGQPSRWWTERGSNRYLNCAEGIEATDRYIASQSRPLAFVVDMRVVIPDA